MFILKPATQNFGLLTQVAEMEDESLQFLQEKELE